MLELVNKVKLAALWVEFGAADGAAAVCNSRKLRTEETAAVWRRHEDSRLQQPGFFISTVINSCIYNSYTCAENAALQLACYVNVSMLTAALQSQFPALREKTSALLQFHRQSCSSLLLPAQRQINTFKLIPYFLQQSALPVPRGGHLLFRYRQTCDLDASDWLSQLCEPPHACDVAAPSITQQSAWQLLCEVWGHTRVNVKTLKYL